METEAGKGKLLTELRLVSRSGIYFSPLALLCVGGQVSAPPFLWG